MDIKTAKSAKKPTEIIANIISSAICIACFILARRFGLSLIISIFIAVAVGFLLGLIFSFSQRLRMSNRNDS